MSLTPETWEQWAGALTAVGTATLGAWKYGARISTWCRHRWTVWRTAAATRATEQQEAERAVRLWKETAELLELESASKDRRIADLEHDLARKVEVIAAQDQRITRKDQRIAHLETLLDGSRR